MYSEIYDIYLSSPNFEDFVNSAKPSISV